MAGDMESLLLKGDDSSSGESDSEQQQTAPSAALNANLPVAGVPSTRTSAPTGSMSQSEMAQRLKSMYSPASKATSGAVSQSVAPLPKPVTTQPSLTMPIKAQQTTQHHPQQQTQMQQNSSNAATNYRASSTSDVTSQQVLQQQQRGVIHQQSQIPVRQQQQQLKQRPAGGISLQQQAVHVSNSTSLPTDQQHSRPIMHQMQAPSIPHRPTGRLPHQQQNARHVPHGQTQLINAQPIRTQAPVAPSQLLQQNVASRSSGYSSVAPQQQQVQQLSSLDRAVMEKKQKERFLVFTRVLMVRVVTYFCFEDQSFAIADFSNNGVFLEIFGAERSSLAQ
jgi:hypothetical protein